MIFIIIHIQMDQQQYQYRNIQLIFILTMIELLSAILAKEIFHIIAIFIFLFLVSYLAKIPVQYRHLLNSWIGDFFICFFIYQDTYAVISDRSAINQHWSNSISFEIITATVLYDSFINRPSDTFSKIHHIIVLLGVIPIYALHSKLMNFILFAACGPFGICLWTLMGLGMFNKISSRTEWTGIFYVHICWRWPLVLIALYEGLQLIRQDEIHPWFVVPIAILFVSIQMVTYFQAKSYFKHSMIKQA